ncbi:UNVERIFIED_CONTAM: hypothetical protein NCL1_41449 [Trichonephila clavipes]
MDVNNEFVLLEHHTALLFLQEMNNDEVEKLAYQLNEEAEQTERPIRRLISVPYITHVLTYWGSYAKIV